MYEDVCYKKSYLTEVVVRVDLATPIVSFEKNLSSKLVNSISKSFPIAEPLDTVGHQFQLGSDGDVKKSEMHRKQWNFFGKKREKQLGINNTSVFIQHKKYSKFEVLKDEFKMAIEAIDKEHIGAMAQRVGLRYVNNFAIDGVNLKEWKKFISEELLSTQTFFDNTNNINSLTRLFHIVELKYTDIDVRFQFGFPNPDFPAIMKRPIFVMDIDAYAQIMHPITESLQFVDVAHRHIQKLFEESITDELRRKMNA